MTGAPRRQRLGRYGEALAVRFLHDRGWLILERNWRSRWGELDIVGLDAGVLVFCEVKTRAADARTTGQPLESVTPAKRARLLRLAGLWLAERGGAHQPVRLDAVGIQLRADGTHDVAYARGID